MDSLRRHEVGSAPQSPGEGKKWGVRAARRAHQRQPAADDSYDQKNVTSVGLDLKLAGESKQARVYQAKVQKAGLL